MYAVGANAKRGSGVRNSLTPRCEMSRIGKQPIPVPGDVKVSLVDGKIAVEGEKGKLELAYHPNILVKHDTAAKAISVTRPNDERSNRARPGLTRALINNMVV